MFSVQLHPMHPIVHVCFDQQHSIFQIIAYYFFRITSLVQISNNNNTIISPIISINDKKYIAINKIAITHINRHARIMSLLCEILVKNHISVVMYESYKILSKWIISHTLDNSFTIKIQGGFGLLDNGNANKCPGFILGKCHLTSE